ncbi:peptidylprolyl isomerase [Mesorhizobium atlanticum]
MCTRLLRTAHRELWAAAWVRSGRATRRSEFEAALGDLAPGEISPLVETRYGIHLIRLTRRIDGRRLPFEAVRERIAAYLTEHVNRQATAQYACLSLSVGRTSRELPSMARPRRWCSEEGSMLGNLIASLDDPKAAMAIIAAIDEPALSARLTAAADDLAVRPPISSARRSAISWTPHPMIFGRSS